MAKAYSMEEQMDVSDLGIEVVTNYLLKHPNVSKIHNVENNKVFQKKDIDLLIKINERWCSIEVKCDTYTSGNLYFETISNINKNTLGCLIYSEADFLFYYFEKINRLYILPMKRFRKWFIENKSMFKKKNPSTKGPNGNIFYMSEGYVIPLALIENQIKPMKIIENVKDNVNIFNREVV